MIETLALKAIDMIGYPRSLDELYRLVIPKDICRKIGICEGDYLEFCDWDWGKSHILLAYKPVKNQPTDVINLTRKLDSLGRIVIPREICRHTNLHPCDTLEIFVFKKGYILLRKGE